MRNLPKGYEHQRTGICTQRQNRMFSVLWQESEKFTACLAERNHHRTGRLIVGLLFLHQIKIENGDTDRK
jgi:hypothetical protein